MKNRSVFIGFLISYISMLLVTSIICMSLYILSTNIIENEISEANASLLRQAKDSIDSRIMKLSDTISEMYVNPRIQAALYSKSPISPDDRMNFLKITDDLKMYKITNNSDDIILNLFNVDKVITAGGITSSRLFHQLYFDTNELGYDKYKSIMNDNKFSKIAIESLILNFDKDKYIMKINSLPYNETALSLGSCVTIMKQSELNEKLSDIFPMDDISAFIVDKYNRIIARTGKELEYSNYTYKYLQELNNNKQKFYKKNIDGESVIVSTLDSDIEDWKYVIQVPEKVFWQKSSSMKKLSLGVIIIGLMVGVIIAYFYSKKNYSSIKNIMTKINITKDSDTNQNEYQLIEQSIVNVLEEKAIMQKRIQSQKEILKANYLRKILKGNVDNKLPIEEACVTYDINFVYSKGIVLVFYIDDCSKIASENNNDDSFTFAQFILKNIFEEMCLNNNYNNYTTSMDQIVANILMFKNGDEEQCLNNVHTMLEEFKNFIEDNFEIEFSIGVSDVYYEKSLEEKVMHISQSYQEALNAVEYRMVLGTGEIIYYNDIKEPKSYYNYPIEIEKKIINCIKSGNYDEAKKQIDTVMENNYSTNISIEMAKCLTFDIMSTILKIIDSKGDEQLLEELKPVKRIINAGSLKELKNEFYIILQRVCEYINNKIQRDSNRGLSERIKVVIAENYSDVNLNISTLADQFNLTPRYLSKIFKTETGTDLLWLIHTTRISRAKELLEEGDKNLTILQVANIVGYSEASSFIRVFKKYEGITPGNYKQMNKAQ